MSSILTINYDPSSEFCSLTHSYNKRFADFVKYSIKPPTHRRYDEVNHKWTVHISKLVPVVAYGKRMFSRVDYSSLPENYQIKIVSELNGNPSSLAINNELQVVDPYTTLFIIPGAPFPVVQAAYKALAFMMHPDKGGSPEDFIRIQAAYDILLEKYEKTKIN
jgi:hypothetical protein